MAKRSNRKLKWGLLLFLVTLVVAPVQMLFLLDYEVDEEYWCSQEHFSTARCEAAEGAVFSTLWTLVVFGLVMLAGIAMLLDLIIMPQRERAASR